MAKPRFSHQTPITNHQHSALTHPSNQYTNSCIVCCIQNQKQQQENCISLLTSQTQQECYLLSPLFMYLNTPRNHSTVILSHPPILPFLWPTTHTLFWANIPQRPHNPNRATKTKQRIPKKQHSQNLTQRCKLHKHIKHSNPYSPISNIEEKQ